MALTGFTVLEVKPRDNFFAIDDVDDELASNVEK